MEFPEIPAKRQKMDDSNAEVIELESMNKEEMSELVRALFGEIVELQQKSELSSIEIQNLAGEVEELKRKVNLSRHENQSFEIMDSMNDLQAALKSRYVRMDELVCNPGLEHLAEEIFSYLEPNDLMNCCLVSKSWKEICEKPMWRLRLEYFTNKKLLKGDPKWKWSGEPIPLVEMYPEYQAVCNYVKHQESLENLRIFAFFLQEFYSLQLSEKREAGLSPIHYAANEGRVDIFEILVKTSVDFNSIYGDKFTALDLACIGKHVELVKLIFKYRKEKNINFDLGQFSNACYSGIKDIVEIFIEYSNENTLDPNFYRHNDADGYCYECF